MKILRNGFSMFLLAVLFFTNVQGQADSKNNTNLNTQSRSLTNYTALSLSIPATVEVWQAAEYAFKITANQEILDNIITEVKDGELVIRSKDNKWKWRGDQNINITLSLPQITSLEINGSGYIIGKSTISSEKLNLLVNGSGQISIRDINVTALSTEINGSGSIQELSGNAEQISMEVNGSGSIKAGGLKSDRSTIAISGSGTVAAGSIQSLDVNIAGSGNVSYRGKPENVKKRIAGSGTVSQE